MLAAQGFESIPPTKIIPLPHHVEIDDIGQTLPLLTIDSTHVDCLCWQGEDPTPCNRTVVVVSVLTMKADGPSSGNVLGERSQGTVL